MYKEILKQHLDQRKEVNHSYSMRSFARDMEIPSSHMSKILNGKQGLSEQRALHLCDKLEITGVEKQNFVDFVLAMDGRAKRTRLEAKSRLEARSVRTDILQ